MPDMKAEAGVRKVELEATVIRADGKREELGVVAEGKATPRLLRWLRERGKES